MIGSRTRSLAAAALLSLTLPAGALAQGTPVASPTALETTTEIGAVRVIGIQTVANDLMVEDTLVGGISGIDYDAETGRWIAISDDRSDNQPARFYELGIALTADELAPVEFTNAVTLLQPNGEPYPNGEMGGNIPDPEAIRIDPVTGQLWYTSEGSRALLIDPFVAATTWDGAFIASPETPEIFHMESGTVAGPRDNQVFEGFTFSADGQSLWIAMEGPLYQDGAPATDTKGTPVRITNLGRDGEVLGQYVYELDPIPASIEGASFYTTGTTEILAVDDTKFLTIERASVADADGVFTNYIKVYEIDVAGATNVAAQSWITEGGYTPVSKRLILDMNAEGITPIDNVEGITWGPVLDNGNRTLVLVSDNNFNDTQVTEFIALEVTA
jgi:hypothetical protein